MKSQISRFQKGFWYAVSRHVLLPVCVLVLFVLLTTFFGWHGPWTDGLVFLAIFCANIYSMCIANWSSWLPGRQIQRDGQGLNKSDVFRFGFALVLAIVLFVIYGLITFIVRSA